VATGETIRAGGRPVRIEVPGWASFSLAAPAVAPAV
jgi:hypothetical protein